MLALEYDSVDATGQTHPIDDRCDGANRSKLLFVARNEQHPLFAITGVNRQRDVHSREDDGVVQRHK